MNVRTIATVAAFLISIGIVAFTMMYAVKVAHAQIPPEIDSSVYYSHVTEYSDGAVLREMFVGKSVNDGSIIAITTDALGNIVEVRPASELESDVYTANLKWAKVENWVQNRSSELSQCETDGQSALALGSFQTMTNGEKNAVINSLIECQIANSKVNRKTINGLLTILKGSDLDVN